MTVTELIEKHSKLSIRSDVYDLSDGLSLFAIDLLELVKKEGVDPEKTAPVLWAHSIAIDKALEELRK